MADKPIRDLPVVTTVDDDIQFPVDQDGTAMRLFIDDLKASFAEYVSSDIDDKVSAAIEDWFDEHGESGGKLCVISGTSPFTSSMTYSELYETLVTNNQPVAFLFVDSGSEYLTSLAYADSSKVKAIFILQKSSGTYPVIYVDINATGTIAINTDTIGSGEQVVQNSVVLRMDDNGYVYNGTSAITGSQINALANSKKAVFIFDEDNQRLYTYGEPNWNGDAQFYLAESTVIHTITVPATRNVGIHTTVTIGEDTNESVTIETFDDIYSTTAEEVTVLMDDSYFGSGKQVTFMVARSLSDGSKQEITGGYEEDYYPFLKRNNGDYMIPKPLPGSVGSPVSANQIAEVIGSYFDHGEIKYGGANTAFSPDFAVDAENPPKIDCSGFVSLILYAINYERSRYNGNASNTFGSYAGTTLPRNPRTCIGGDNRRHCYNAAEMAMYYAQQNRLFYVDYERDHPAAQLQVGDVLFFSRDFVYTSDDGDSVDYGNRYLNIYHCGIVLAVYPESDTVMLANAGLPPSPRYSQQIAIENDATKHNNINITSTNISAFDTTTKSGTVVYARPIYPDFTQNAVQILSGATFLADVVSPSTTTAGILARLFFAEPLKPNKVYTLVAEGDLPNDPNQNDKLILRFSTASSGGTSIDYRVNQLAKYNDKVVYVFVPPEDIDSRGFIYLAAYRPSNASGTDSNTYNLHKVAVYEGLCPDAPAIVERIDEPMTLGTAFNVSASNAEYKAWKDGANLHLHFKAPLAENASSDGMVAIGTIKADYFSKTGTERNLTCVAGAGDTRSMVISAGGAVSVFAKSTDTTSTFFKFDIVI